MLWLRFKKLVPLIFTMTVCSQPLWAETKTSLKARACEVILKAAENEILYSDVRDRGKIIHLGPHQISGYEWGPDKSGLATYLTSNQPLHSQTDETMISVWAPSSTPGSIGKLYAVAEESSRQIGDFRHSSFNNNQPVYAAWSMNVDQGHITELIDASGHYQPTPYHMYLVTEHLLAQGFDLSQTQVIFDYGLGRLSGLRIEASLFVKSMRKLSPKKQKSFIKVIGDLQILHEFLEFMARESSDLRTKILVDLYWIRMRPIEESTPFIKAFAKKISLWKLDQDELKEYLKVIFRLSGGPYIPYHPIYLGMNSKKTDSMTATIKQVLLDHISEEEKRKQVRSLIQQIRKNQ